jgi:hypothetical protein
MSAYRINTKTESESVIHWRTECLVDAGLPMQLAHKIAADSAYDLHAVLDLVARGCPPELALRILAPLDGGRAQR